SCHIPETGFVDFTFHDVGERHDAGEAELNTRAPLWGVNTASLIGIWDSPPYVGAAQPKDPETLIEEILDLRRPGRSAPHGQAAGLTGRQVADLAEFLSSIDGSTSAAEVRGAVDRTPPRVVRVEAASLTRIDAWFSESVSPSAADPSAWRLQAVGGPDVPILAAFLDPQNGDRVTFTVGTMHHDCGPATYALIPLGPIFDLADSASGGTANALDVADPSNRRTFVIGNALTVTFGASGYENFTIPVHDAGTVYGSPGGANGSVWLRSNNGGAQRNTDFLRFEWEAAFATTGVVSAGSIVDASISILPAFGDAQSIEARRVLQRWWDYGGGDQTQNPVNPVNGHGGPTYSYSEYNVKSWNAANASSRTAGVNGQNAADYFGTRDTGFDPDVVITMPDLNQRAVFGGAGVLGAFRFWFQNPSLDQGYALQLTAAAKQESRFHAAEEELRQYGPTMSLTYMLRATSSPPPAEVSSSSSGSPLTVDPGAGGELLISFQDLGGSVGGYNVYEGTLGGGYNHVPNACGVATTLVNGRRQARVVPGAGNSYYLITAYDLCQEGISGADSSGATQPGANLACTP
ncbi:MAG TPA: hypothetical protein VFE84_13895, partial [Patescibacteria group bacterium]|nr:hypothetical protein [Patescibacteria group bacterium]